MLLLEHKKDWELEKEFREQLLKDNMEAIKNKELKDMAKKIWRKFNGKKTIKFRSKKGNMLYGTSHTNWEKISLIGRCKIKNSKELNIIEIEGTKEENSLLNEFNIARKRK